MIWHRQGIVGAGLQLHRCEGKDSVSNVLQVVDFVFASRVAVLHDLSRDIVLDVGSPVFVVASRAAACVTKPEIVEHVLVEADPLAWREAEGPHAHAIGFGEKNVAYATVATTPFEIP